jgi:predicted transcriptional regulator
MYHLLNDLEKEILINILNGKSPFKEPEYAEENAAINNQISMALSNLHDKGLVEGFTYARTFNGATIFLTEDKIRVTDLGKATLKANNI